MRRRDVLRATGGALALGAIGTRTSAHPGPYRPLGTVEIEGAKETVLDEEGAVAYVAATDGFATVDVSTPASPELLAERRDVLDDHENGPLTQIFDVKTEDDRLVAPGPANAQGGDALEGFAVYDVSDPADPTFVAFHETDFPIHNCFIHDGVVYLTGNDRERNPLVMVDVSGDEPEEVGRWSILDHDEAWGEVNWFLRVLHDVWVQDDVAYLVQWEAGTWIVDVSDPANPEFVSNFRAGRLDELAAIDSQEGIDRESKALPGNDHYVQVSEDASLLVVGEEAWNVGETPDTPPGGLELWDISDPNSPERLSRIEAPPSPAPTIGGTWTTSHNFDLAGDRLYTSWYQGGVKIFDVSGPTAPEEIAWWRDPDNTGFWTAQLAVLSDKSGEGFFVASSYGVSSGIEEAVYTFPDEAGQQKDPPSLSPTPTPEGTGTTTTNGTPTPTKTPAGAARPGNTTTATTTDGQSGFGLVAGIAGLVGGAWRMWTDDE
jgi:hypothetical protein